MGGLGGAQVMQHSPLVKKSWGLVMASLPWDQLGAKLYEAIFEVRGGSGRCKRCGGKGGYHDGLCSERGNGERG